MAFCNNRAGCGHSCGRQDDHGGGCDCFEEKCSYSSRHKPVAVVVQPLATFYAVRCDGKYYRTYSQGGRSGWCDSLEDGKVYTRKGPAQGLVTQLSDTNKSTIELVELVVTEVRVIDQSSRLAEAKARKVCEEADRRARAREQEIAKIKDDISRAQARLTALEKEG